MKIFAALVSSDERLCTYFTGLVGKAFPPDALNRSVYMGRRIEVVTLGLSSGLAGPEVARRLVNGARSSECFLLFVENGCQGLIGRLRNAALVTEFSSIDMDKSPRNAVNALAGKALRSFAVIWSNRGDDLVRLPARNFISPELDALLECCRDHANVAGFGESFERRLARLRERERPRRKSSYKTKYAVDDEGKFFNYGIEKHARFDTGRPHDEYCELQGLFRFGSCVDKDRHFNVSKGEGDETYIAGDFPNCHDNVVSVPGHTHLNMFCNDFF